MVVDLHNTNWIYHTMPYYTIWYQIFQTVIFHTSSPNFYMVEDLGNIKRPYNVIPYDTITYQYQKPKISDSHHSVICRARSSKFCMVVDLDNTNKLYHAIPCHAIPYYTTRYQVIPNISKCHNWILFQTRCPKFSVIVYFNRSYHVILYHTLKYQIIPNTKYFKLS